MCRKREQNTGAFGRFFAAVTRLGPPLTTSVSDAALTQLDGEKGNPPGREMCGYTVGAGGGVLPPPAGGAVKLSHHTLRRDRHRQGSLDWRPSAGDAERRSLEAGPARATIGDCWRLESDPAPLSRRPLSGCPRVGSSDFMAARRTR